MNRQNVNGINWDTKLASKGTFETAIQQATAAELNALVTSVLDKACKGEF